MLGVPFLWLSLRLDDILATNRSPVGTIALSPGSSSSLPLVTPYVIVVFRSNALIVLRSCTTLRLVTATVTLTLYYSAFPSPLAGSRKSFCSIHCSHVCPCVFIWIAFGVLVRYRWLPDGVQSSTFRTIRSYSPWVAYCMARRSRQLRAHDRRRELPRSFS